MTVASHGPALILTPSVAGLRQGRDNTLMVLVRVQAPDAPPAARKARPSQAIALVIDRSGSMDGAPLDEAKRCAEYLLSRLHPADSVALVSFDDKVRTLWPASPLGDGHHQRAAIACLRSGGNTNLEGGWSAGVAALRQVGGAGVKRVLLLSDGEANAGVTNSDEIAQRVVTASREGISTTTCGLGHAFNEELMVAMGNAGGGNHYYGESADDLKEPFSRELDLLDALYLRAPMLSVTTAGGIGVQMLNDISAGPDGWQLSDVAYGAEAWAVLKVTLPADAIPAIGRDVLVLKVQVKGIDADGNPVTLGTKRLDLVSLTAAMFKSLPTDTLVACRLTELEAGQMLGAMRLAAKAGNWAEVAQMLQRAREKYGSDLWLKDVLDAMQGLLDQRDVAMFHKEAMYTEGILSRRLAMKLEAPYRSAFDELAVPSHLQRRGRQGKRDAGTEASGSGGGDSDGSGGGHGDNNGGDSAGTPGQGPGAGQTPGRRRRGGGSPGTGGN